MISISWDGIAEAAVRNFTLELPQAESGGDEAFSALMIAFDRR
jgi:hypothetical protein